MEVWQQQQRAKEWSIRWGDGSVPAPRGRQLDVLAAALNQGS